MFKLYFMNDLEWWILISGWMIDDDWYNWITVNNLEFDQFYRLIWLDDFNEWNGLNDSWNIFE